MSTIAEGTFDLYFIFGEHPDGVRVDVANSCDDTVVGCVTRADAEKLIMYQNAAVEAIEKLAYRFMEVDNEEFKKIWFGEILPTAKRKREEFYKLT